MASKNKPGCTCCKEPVGLPCAACDKGAPATTKVVLSDWPVPICASASLTEEPPDKNGTYICVEDPFSLFAPCASGYPDPLYPYDRVTVVFSIETTYCRVTVTAEAGRNFFGTHELMATVIYQLDIPMPVNCLNFTDLEIPFLSVTNHGGFGACATFHDLSVSKCHLTSL